MLISDDAHDLGLGRFDFSFGFGLRPCELKPALFTSDAAYDLGFGGFCFGLRPCELKPALFTSDAAYDLGFGGASILALAFAFGHVR